MRAVIERGLELRERLIRTLESEHCSYAHTRDRVAKVLESAPRDSRDPNGNAGWVRFDEKHDLAIRIESHNHPSALNPFQGAATGVGGIMRDILAAGAHPIAFADGLALGGSPEQAEAIADGIGYYANTCGIPTIAGETRRGEVFASAPLVNVMCVGAAPRARRSRLLAPGDMLVLVGRPTGRDGLGGAVFASTTLGEYAGSADPTQRADALAGHNLIRFCSALSMPESGLTDLGAGGLGIAVCEWARRSNCRVTIDLEEVPVQSAEVELAERLLGESQERLLVATRDPAAVIRSARSFELEAAIVGSVRDGRGSVFCVGAEILFETNFDTCCEKELPIDSKRQYDIHKYDRYKQIYERYDWGVGGRTVLPPGAGGSGAELAGVLHPRYLARPVAVALVSNLDAISRGEIGRAELESSVELAMREAAARVERAGANPLAVTNGINVGDPRDPVVSGHLDALFRGLTKAAQAIGIPIVSGNVSCYNAVAGTPVPPTIYLGVVGRG